MPTVAIVASSVEISRRLLAELKAQGLSDQQIADRLGVSRARIEEALRPAPLAKCGDR